MITSKETFKLCTQASYQIEAMCLSLQSAAQSKDSNITDALPYLVLANAQRISELNAAWVNTLDCKDDGSSETLAYALFGISEGVKS